MAKIVTLGEIMLRLSPAGQYRFVQADDGFQFAHPRGVGVRTCAIPL